MVNYDAGCFLMDRDLLSDIWNEQLELTYPPRTCLKTYSLRNKAFYEDSLGGGHSFSRGAKLRFEFVWGDESTMSNALNDIREQMTKLKTISNQNKYQRLDFDEQDCYGNGYFEHDGDTLIFYTIDDYYKNIMNGYGVTITILGNDYLYKVTSSQESGDYHYFTLDNIEDYEDMSITGDCSYKFNFIDTIVIKEDLQLEQTPFVSILPDKDSSIFRGGKLVLEER